MEYALMNEKLKNTLNPDRYAHSKGVEEFAAILAQKHGVDTQKARIAGLLHDLDKNMDKEISREIIEKSNLDNSIKETPSLWHGPVGAMLLEKEYEITDPEIFDAVFYHTIGKVNMPPLTKIIYVADAIEPGRDEYFSWSKACRETALSDLDKAVLEVTDRTINSLIERGMKINPVCIDIHNQMVQKY